MSNIRTERSSGYAGIAFVVVLIATMLLTGQPPAANAPAAEIVAAATAHANGWLLSAWLGFPLSAFFLWFVVGLRTYLREGAGLDEGLPAYAFGAGLLTIVLGMAGSFLQAAIVLGIGAKLGPEVVRGLYLLMGTSQAAMDAPLAIFALAVAHSGRRHGTLPPWLYGLGYLTALAAVLASPGIALLSGPFAPMGPLAIVSFLLVLVFVVCTSVVVVRRATGGAVSAP